MPSTARIAAAAIFGVRIAYGAGLLAAPAATAGPWLGRTATKRPTKVALRGLGGRELAVATVGLVAALRGAPVRPWLAVNATGDVADVAGTLLARGTLPPGAVGAVTVAGGLSAALTLAAAAAVDA